jgi:hypothetical protein
MARAMIAWSSDLLFCTDGPARLSAGQRQQFDANGIEIVAEKIIELTVTTGSCRRCALQAALSDVYTRSSGIKMCGQILSAVCYCDR